MSGQTPDDEPRNRLATATPGSVTADVHLFPGCDPRGVLTRALAPDAPPWSTRPDALVFGWMLALPPGVDSRKAASAVLLAAASRPDRHWSENQVRLLEAIRAVVIEPQRKRLPP